MLSVKAKKIRSRVIEGLHRSILNEAYKEGGPIYVNWEGDTHSSINIDYNDFEALTFTFVEVRNVGDAYYRVEINSDSKYLLRVIEDIIENNLEEHEDNWNRYTHTEFSCILSSEVRYQSAISLITETYNKVKVEKRM